MNPLIRSAPRHGVNADCRNRTCYIFPTPAIMHFVYLLSQYLYTTAMQLQHSSSLAAVVSSIISIFDVNLTLTTVFTEKCFLGYGSVRGRNKKEVEANIPLQSSEYTPPVSMSSRCVPLSATCPSFRTIILSLS